MSKNQPSRRDFTRAIVAATATPLWTTLRPPPPPRRQDRELGFALVGLGNLSTNQLAPALQRTRRCRLAAIVTGTPAKAARWTARYGIPSDAVYSYDTMAQMARNPDIDVAYVVTPNALHAEHTIAAARAGKHVLCEKPMEVSAEKCEAMIVECERAGRFHFQVDRDRFIVGSVANFFETVKGHPVLIDAFAQFAAVDREALLVLACSSGP